MKTKTAVVLTLMVAFLLAGVWRIVRWDPETERIPGAKLVQFAPAGSSLSAPALATPEPAGAAPPSAVSAKTGDTARATAALQALRNRLNDPMQQAARLLAARAHVEQTKGRLFQRLKKNPPEKLDRLKTLLAETELATNVAALPSRVDPSAAEVRQINDTVTRIQAEGDSRVKALLGPDDYANYAAYQKSETYRDTIEQVTNIMRSRGAAITDDQQEAVLDAYAEAMYAAAQDSAGDSTAADYATMTDAQRQALRLRQLARFDQYLADKAAGVLDPANFKLFMESQYVQESGAPP